MMSEPRKLLKAVALGAVAMVAACGGGVSSLSPEPVVVKAVFEEYVPSFHVGAGAARGSAFGSVAATQAVADVHAVFAARYLEAEKERQQKRREARQRAEARQREAKATLASTAPPMSRSACLMGNMKGPSYDRSCLARQKQEATAPPLIARVP
jgi:hypothetical protein